MHIIAFLCYTQIIYNTNFYLLTASNVRIPIITVSITDFWCVRKSHAASVSNKKCVCPYVCVCVRAYVRECVCGVCGCACKPMC